MCTKVESVSVRWDLYECVCGYDLRCDGGWDDLWSWPPFQPCITIIAWAGLERIILQEEEEEGGLLLGIFFLSFLALAGWLQWGIVMMSVQAHSNGLFLFLRPLLCVHLISPFLLGIRVYNYYSFRCISKKMAHTHDDDDRPELVRAAGWLMSKRDISVYLFIYLFVKDSPCWIGQPVVLSSFIFYIHCVVYYFLGRRISTFVSNI